MTKRRDQAGFSWSEAKSVFTSTFLDRASETGKFVRYVLTGLLTTGICYLVFIAFMRAGTAYPVSAVLSWAAGLVVGFTVNRRFTFGITGGGRRTADFLLYAVGAVLQLLVSLASYWLWLGVLTLPPTLAFVLTAVPTTAASFLFMRLVTFRRASAAQSTGPVE